MLLSDRKIPCSPYSELLLIKKKIPIVAQSNCLTAFT